MVGLVAAFAAVIFEVVAHLVQNLLWSELPEIVARSSASALGLVVVGKALAYGLSLGAGFRSGITFSAVFLGIGVLASVVLPGLKLKSSPSSRGSLRAPQPYCGHRSSARSSRRCSAAPPPRRFHWPSSAL